MDEQRRQLQRAADEAALPIFPGFPTGGTIARWEGDDLHEFVTMAADVGAPLLYAATVTAGQICDVEQLDVDATGYPPDTPVSLVAGWAAGPVVHTFALDDSVWAEAFDAAVTDAEVADLRADIEWEEQTQRVEELARKVVHDPAFWDHGSPARTSRQEAAVRRLLPDADLDEDMISRVAHAADRLDQIEFQADREANMADRARALLADGATKRATCEQLGITTSVLNRVLQTYPPTR